MRLATFILSNMESILVQWEAFAATQLPAAASMNTLTLRDHAQQILEAVAEDLAQPQNRDSQTKKSLGLAPRLLGSPATAAQTHATLRAKSGFNINQLAAEYRALRACVLRLWTDALQPAAPHVEDIMRFNEAIDQAVAESINFFSAQVEQARNLLLGMLGHDLRSPLQTIRMTASYLVALNAGSDVSMAASRLIGSGARMQALLDDLVDFNRTNLGLGINISKAKVDLAHLFTEEVDRLRAAHPSHRVDLEIHGDCSGVWDGRRLLQVLGNLVLNAIKYGSPGEPVHVGVIGAEQEVQFKVTNRGATIDESALAEIFEPLRRGIGLPMGGDGDGSLGLGLYIAREIAMAHGGEIEARSNSSETVFVVRLPRSGSRDPR
ncbi:MAG TPA: HAMP domain-containing sensor histidine kinase [Casimicrobiaceae bacterium]|nr:HAMP domain-containing sensor histidine kinase [Casimicrobiaceae bacterium]